MPVMMKFSLAFFTEQCCNERSVFLFLNIIYGFIQVFVYQCPIRMSSDMIFLCYAPVPSELMSCYIRYECNLFHSEYYVGHSMLLVEYHAEANSFKLANISTT